MARLATIQCAACGTELKRSARSRWASCQTCTRLVTAHIRATVGTRDPSAWMRACSATFGNRERFVAAATAQAA